MPTYGVSNAGFLRKPVFAIRADIEASQHAEISPNLDLSSATPWGQNNGIIANEIGIAWEILEICYQAFDPDMAEGFLMESLCKLTGTERRAAGHSLVTLECDLEDGVTLESGVHFAAVNGDSTSLWTPVVDFTAPSTGTHAVVFQSENTGPIPAQPNTITVVHTVIPGWSAVNNPLAAQVGRNVDTDEELRARREAQLTAAGSSTVDAIRSDVLEIPEVISCTVFENDSDGTVDSMPPHSVEALVFDGETPAVDDDVIAQAIWNSKAGGIATVGNESGTAKDAQGGDRTVYFSRPDVVPIYIDISVNKGPDYDAAGGDAALAEYIATTLARVYTVGVEVDYRHVDSVALNFVGFKKAVAKVTAFTMGLTPSPSGTVDIPIDQREIASFDPSRIVVTS